MTEQFLSASCAAVLDVSKSSLSKPLTFNVALLLNSYKLNKLEK